LLRVTFFPGQDNEGTIISKVYRDSLAMEPLVLLAVIVLVWELRVSMPMNSYFLSVFSPLQVTIGCLVQEPFIAIVLEFLCAAFVCVLCLVAVFDLCPSSPS